MMEQKTLVGTIAHYYNKIGVAVVELTGTLKVGDNISIEGPSTKLAQTVESMQIEHEQVKEAKKGQAIGMKVKDKVHEKDQVFVMG